MTEYTQLTRRQQIRRMRRVAERALPQYGIELVSLSLLAHSYNTTFTVTARDGARYVLHIPRPVEETMSDAVRRTRAESELWWLERVRADLNLSVPVAVHGRTGGDVVSIAGEGMASPRLCTLFHWVDGRFVRHRLTPTHLAAVGRVTARLHNHSRQLRVPAWFERPRVDVADTETEKNVVRLFTDQGSTEAAEVIRRVFERVRRAQQELGDGSDTFGLIHADIHQRNYLFRQGAVRLIDFGDCGWGHYLYDLAVTVSELDAPHRSKLRVALLGGYRRVRDLSLAQEALIDSFVMLREVQNLAWFVKAREDPGYRNRAAQVGERVADLERLLSGGAV